MSTVVGIDLSLTSTGIAIITDEPGSVPAVDRIQSKGSKDATLAERHQRLGQIVHRVSDIAIRAGGPSELPALAVIEGPSFGQARQGGQHDRAGLWWLLVARLHVVGIRVVEVSPAGRAKYATGKGNGAKDAVLAAVVRRYTDIEVTGNDEADALILAAMGARHLGHPIEASLPQANLAAMDSVAWPAIEVTA